MERYYTPLLIGGGSGGKSVHLLLDRGVQLLSNAYKEPEPYVQQTAVFGDRTLVFYAHHLLTPEKAFEALVNGIFEAIGAVPR